MHRWQNVSILACFFLRDVPVKPAVRPRARSVARVSEWETRAARCRLCCSRPRRSQVYPPPAAMVRALRPRASLLPAGKSRQIGFFVWVTLSERKWSILAERRSFCSDDGAVGKVRHPRATHPHPRAGGRGDVPRAARTGTDGHQAVRSACAWTARPPPSAVTEPHDQSRRAVGRPVVHRGTSADAGAGGVSRAAYGSHTSRCSGVVIASGDEGRDESSEDAGALTKCRAGRRGAPGLRHAHWRLQSLRGGHRGAVRALRVAHPHPSRSRRRTTVGWRPNGPRHRRLDAPAILKACGVRRSEAVALAMGYAGRRDGRRGGARGTHDHFVGTEGAAVMRYSHWLPVVGRRFSTP